MSLQPVQAQWSLDTTSTSVLSVARGVLHAATSDNVQPLAIIACERFGNTIAMSQETCRKMEVAVLPTPKPATVQFLRGVVGYSPNDCATQLGKSLAGVQFLGLASALVNTMSPFNAGVALELMLKNSAADRTLLPTARQLKDLLASLEHRCIQARFMDFVIGWQKFLKDAGVPVPERCFRPAIPSTEGLNALVDAFRQLSRIGESTVLKATIKLGSSAAWVVAFAKWCLGIPPSIYLEDMTPILEQPGAQVVVIWCSRDDHVVGLFEVTMHHTVSGPMELLAGVERAYKGSNGMVSVENYVQYRLWNTGFVSGTALRALQEALPLAIQQVISLLRIGHADNLVATHQKNTYNNKPELRLIPFSDDYAILKMLHRFLGTEVMTELPALESGRLIGDCALVQTHLRFLEGQCHCCQCLRARCPHLEGFDSSHCLRRRFFVATSTIVADILALSLFQTPDSLLVRLWTPRHNGGFQKAVSNIISTGNSEYCDFTQIFHWALQIVGHDFDRREPRHWVMSCHFGQAVYPSMFETHRVSKRGYLALNWLPGRLRYMDETYNLVFAGMPPPPPPPPPPLPNTRSSLYPSRDVYAQGVSGPRNFLGDSRLTWSIIISADDLVASLEVRNKDDKASPPGIWRGGPASIFDNLGHALLLESCPHDPSSELQTVNQSCYFESPFCDFGYEDFSGGSDRAGVSSRAKRTKIAVVAVDGADDLRLFAFSHLRRRLTVIRGAACLQCCIDECRNANASIIVL